MPWSNRAAGESPEMPFRWPLATALVLISAAIPVSAAATAAKPTPARISMNQTSTTTPTTADTTVKPPVARRQPKMTVLHGRTLVDDYAWMRDAGYPEIDDPEILAHLKAENAYFEAQMAPHQPLIDTLFKEMRGRIKEADASVPATDGDWLYWVEFEEGAEYRKWYRRPVGLAEGDRSKDQLILDEVALAEGKEYLRLSDVSVSPDGHLMAFGVDDNGSERFEARFKDLRTGQMLPDVIPGTLSSLTWTADNKGLVYGLANANWRTDNARLHVLGTPVNADRLLYKEPDIGFGVSVGRTSDDRFLVIATGDNETSEIRLVPASEPTAPPLVVAPRRKGREYSVDHRDGTLWIVTNDDHANFRVATAPLDRPGDWTTVIPGSDQRYITGIDLFRDFFVVESRVEGLDDVAVHQYASPAIGKPIAFPEASYVAGLGDNREWHQTVLRLDYESMVTPDTVLDYDVATGAMTTRKVAEIPSGYDKADYVSERRTIAARDGTRVPVSLVYKRGTRLDGSAPLHLYAYGSYGYAVPPGFATGRLSLVDRGMIYAIAHIRGGDDMGRAWYLAGKTDRRKNSFTDFIDVARGLIADGYTSAGRISIEGRSAGGQLMGVVYNEAPELWGAVLAGVPFVDVINTMVDETLPLTPGEWPEWGNPKTDKAAFDYMLSYSPYENVTAKAYPPMLVSAGLNDPRVTYWEPAKWVAKLRATRTNDALLLFKTNMGAGHGGQSGRWQSLREDAEEYAFILTQLGVEK